ASNSTPAELRAALRAADRWGITPLTTTGNDAAARDAELGDRVRRASEVLARRVEGTPDSAGAMDLSAARLAELVAGLVAPEAACPVCSRLPVAAFQG